MPLRKALLEAPLSSGLGQNQDYRNLAVDGAAVMTNCVRQKNGDIRKRFGCTQLTLTTVARTFSSDFNPSRFAAIRGLNYRNAPLVFDGYTVCDYSDAANKWRMLDAMPEAVADRRFILASGIPLTGIVPINPAAGDIEYCAALDYYVCTYMMHNAISRTNINTTIIDGTSGAIIQPIEILDRSGDVGVPRLIICGTTAIIAYMRVDGLRIGRIDLTNISAGWTVVIFDATAAVLGAGYDIAPVVGDPTRFVVGYFRPGNISVFATAAVSTLTATRTLTTTTAVGPGFSVAVAAALNEWCWIAYSVQPSASTQIFQTWAFNDTTSAQIALVPAFTTAPAPNTWAQVSIAKISPTDAVILYTNQDSTAGPPFLLSTYGNQVTASGGGALVGAERRIPGMQLYSKPAKITTPLGDRWYSLMYVNSSLQGTIVLVAHDWISTTINGSDGGRAVATVAPRLVKTMGASVAGQQPGGIFATTRLPVVSPTTLAGLIPINTSLVLSGLYAQTFDFDSKTRYFGGVLGPDTLGVSAGTPMTFDGQTMAEMGFIYYPEAVFPTLIAGSLTGKYSYIVTYEWPDAAGNIHRSATSPPIAVTATSNYVTLTLPTMGLTWRQRWDTNLSSNYGNFTLYAGTMLAPAISLLPKICVYRTLAGGSTYYFVDSIDNDPTVSSVTLTDNTLDISLTQNGVLLYTTGGVLDNYCPPSAKICVTHKNRWFLAGCDDPTAIWPSKSFTYGEVPGFNEQMNFNATGEVTAMASLDEKLIIFVQRGDNQYGIEYIVGDGPFDTGASNDWTNPPQPIPSSVGAVDQRSIVVTELGVMFLSLVGAPNGGGGIFLLSRDLQVHYLSGAVEDFIAANPICTGAVCTPSQGRCYFEMAPTETFNTGTLGARLVYDYINQCWSSDTHYNPDVLRDGVAARTTWVAGGRGFTLSGNANMPLVYWADSLGSVYRESSGIIAQNTYADVSRSGTAHWVTATFTSAWFKPALSGFARFWRVQIQGDMLDKAQLSTSYQFDYAPASNYSETNTVTDNDMLAFNRYPQVDIEHLVGNQKSKAIQVTLVDAAPLGGFSTGQGLSWATISIECGIDDGGRFQNLPAGQRS